MKIRFEDQLYKVEPARQNEWSRGWTRQRAVSADLSYVPVQARRQIEAALGQINRQINLRAFLTERTRIVSGRRLETMRGQLEQRLNNLLLEIRPTLASLILEQPGKRIQGRLQGFLPAYRPLSLEYALRKKALAEGRHNRPRSRLPNYLRRNPGLAQRTSYYAWSGELVSAIRRTSSISHRIGAARVTWIEQREADQLRRSNSVFSPTRIRGERTSTIDGETLRDTLGKFQILMFHKLSIYELNQIYNYKPGAPGEDIALPYTLFGDKNAHKLRGRAGSRPLVLPTLAFFAQKRVTDTINNYLETSGSTLFYDRSSARRR